MIKITLEKTRHHENTKQKKLEMLTLISDKRKKEKKSEQEKCLEIKKDNTNGRKVYSLRSHNNHKYVCA